MSGRKNQLQDTFSDLGSSGSHVGSLSEAIATPKEKLDQLENWVDDRQQASGDRVRTSSLSKSSNPIQANSRPVKITVGFGPGSLTNLTPSAPAAGSPALAPTSVAAAQSPRPDKAARAAAAAKEFPKKPKPSKSERRALQEKQRAEKAAKLDTDGKGSSSKGGAAVSGAPAPSGGGTIVVPGADAGQRGGKVAADDEKRNKERSKRLRKEGVPERASAKKQVQLFSHLHQYDCSVSLTSNIPFGASKVHPCFIRLGLKHSEGTISGSTARCTSLLAALREFIGDFTPSPKKQYSVDLLAAISPLISFVAQCRQLADSMGNAIKFLKKEISELPPDLGNEACKESLQATIDKFVQERIVLAQQVITDAARSKIKDGDVVLVHGGSDLVVQVLRKARAQGLNFRVVVVDSRPKCTGINVLEECLSIGIKTTYVLINAVSYIMRDVTKVMLSAHAILANGFVMGRVGSSLISMIAKAHSVPVLVVCETYKFSDRVQTDAFVFNELGDPNIVAKLPFDMPSKLDGWEDVPSLGLLNLIFDVTPPEFIDMVVTDIGMIPCTSVPVVLRVKEQQTQ